MTNHEQLKVNLATAIANNSEIRDYCIEHFGRGALVIVNCFGSEGTPGEKESPFVFIFSENAENEGGFVEEETYRATIVVGAVDPAYSPTKVITTPRTSSANGLMVNGIAAKLETLRNKIELVARGGGLGAVVRSVSREESSTVEFPLEWAKLTVEFYEPTTL